MSEIIMNFYMCFLSFHECVKCGPVNVVLCKVTTIHACIV